MRPWAAPTFTRSLSAGLESDISCRSGEGMIPCMDAAAILIGVVIFASLLGLIYAIESI